MESGPPDEGPQRRAPGQLSEAILEECSARCAFGALRVLPRRHRRGGSFARETLRSSTSPHRAELGCGGMGVVRDAHARPEGGHQADRRDNQEPRPGLFRQRSAPAGRPQHPTSSPSSAEGGGHPYIVPSTSKAQLAASAGRCPDAGAVARHGLARRPSTPGALHRHQAPTWNIGRGQLLDFGSPSASTAGPAMRSTVVICTTARAIGAPASPAAISRQSWSSASCWRASPPGARPGRRDGRAAVGAHVEHRFLAGAIIERRTRPIGM
jgi:hypothetical protein